MTSAPGIHKPKSGAAFDVTRLQGVSMSSIQP
jgi:hypothetical protein